MKHARRSGAPARDNLYTLAFRDRSRTRAKRVVQSLVSIFVESSLGASRKDTDSAKVFIDEQIKTYEAKLEEAETRLKEFRLRNIDLQTADGKDSAARIGEIGAPARAGAARAARSRDTRATRPSQQLAAERRRSRPARRRRACCRSRRSRCPTPEIDARIEAQKRNLDNLLQRYTEQHPDVISTRRLIKDLEEQKKKEVAELRKRADRARRRRRSGGAEQPGGPGTQPHARGRRGPGRVAARPGRRVPVALRAGARNR